MLPDLRTTDGRRAMEAAIAWVKSIPEADPVRRATRLRSRLEADLATAALAQSELRLRGRVKFGQRAERMYFTAAGLEQASRPEVAAHRAARFAGAGIGSVLDLCCGIGADALAFAAAGLAVHALERDPATAAVAAANLTDWPATVERCDAEAVDWRAAESVFLDPARRSAIGRTFDPASYSPAFSFVTEVVGSCRYAAAKLGPGLDHALVSAGVEAEWVSYRSGVKETVFWSPGFTTGVVTRRATVLPSGAELTDTDPGEDSVATVGSFVYEPDGAVIRAGLVRQCAAVLSGWRLNEHLAYLSADRFTPTPLARAYEVLEVLPFSVKRLRAELRRRDVGIVEIKKRGVDVDPARLRRELKPTGGNSLTVLLARTRSGHLAILAQPVRAS